MWRNSNEKHVSIVSFQETSSQQSIFMKYNKMHYIFWAHILFYVGDFQVFFYWLGGLCEWVIDRVMASSSPG